MHAVRVHIGIHRPRQKGIFRGSLMNECDTGLSKSDALLRHEVERKSCETNWANRNHQDLKLGLS